MTAPGGSLRIALFADGYAPLMDGAAGTVRRLVRAVRARGGDVRVFTAADAGADDDVVEHVASVPLLAYPELRLAGPERSRTGRALSAWRPTLVHIASPFGLGLLGRAAARALGVPFVTSFHPSAASFARHAGFGALSGPGWAYLRWFHNGGARTYVQSRAAATELRAQGFERLAVWSGGVDLERFGPAYRSDAMRARMGATEDSIVVAHAGRIANDRAFDVANAVVRAVQETTRRHVVWAVAGDGPDLARWRAAAPENTVFLGPLSGDELSEFHASADIGFYPYAGDVPDDAILEAMASGVPVLAASSPASRELLAGMRGATATAGDVEAMALRLISLVGDARERAVLRDNGLAYARRRGWDDILDDLVASFERVTRDARSRRGGVTRAFADAAVPRTMGLGLADMAALRETRPTYTPRESDASPRA